MSIPREKILIIGSGPITIGQACEFDYSGTQACRVLRDLGHEIVLVNSNPATVMTDPSLADATYIEPLTVAFLEKIIENEKPTALLPTMGGQTALNLALELYDAGILKKWHVRMIGATPHVIRAAEDRQIFREIVEKAGFLCPKSCLIQQAYEAEEVIEKIGFPAIIRPSFTLGGTGGGIVFNRSELIQKVEQGLRASPVHEVLLEESLIGWKEYEMEVVRDCADNAIVVCAIENVDPMGVHTGDSITVAPALTLTDKEYQVMRDASLAILRAVGVTMGGANVQFSINPYNGQMRVIEMNPRVSRSSALASKATGFPIAKVAAQLALGYRLDELQNDMIKSIPASFEPAIDYVVTKIPRFTFEKFDTQDNTLSSSMRSVGEVMAVGRTFAESFQKALCSLDIGLSGLDEPPHMTLPELQAALTRPQPNKPLFIAQALRMGMSVEEIHSFCQYDPWFIEQFKILVEAEGEVAQHGLPQDADAWYALKSRGFSDARLARLCQVDEAAVRQARWAAGVHPVYKRIDSCAAEFPTTTSYLYSTYHGLGSLGLRVDESAPQEGPKAIVIGSGPNRIGQGIEFDYCCTHAALSLSQAGVASIMVNVNPETVSTDYDMVDKLYFEPLTAEHILEIQHTEERVGHLLGVIVQFSGGTGLNLSKELAGALPILGTQAPSIDLAEDRERFQNLIKQLGLRQPEGGMATNLDQAQEIAARVGYPVLARPSYVLGGRAMAIVYNEASLQQYVHEHMLHTSVLIDKYVQDAVEVDVDVLADGDDAFICGIMEHIEEAGVHSGDSACVFPPHTLSGEVMQSVAQQAKKLACALNVKGFLNVQFAVKDCDVYVLEANPRASRTVPFLAKATNLPLVSCAVRVMLGERLPALNLHPVNLPYVAVKEAVFPFVRFPASDLTLGPEMRSTGEIMSLDKSFALAYAKSQVASGMCVPTHGLVFLSLKDADKPRFLPAARRLIDLGFRLIATHGTARFLKQNGLEVMHINKVAQGRPHIVDAIRDGKIDMIFNTTEGAQAIKDSASLRWAAEVEKVPYHTTCSGSLAMVEAMSILTQTHEPFSVQSLQAYSKTLHPVNP